MLNEHDLRDFPNSPYQDMQQVKLYQLNNNTDFFYMQHKYTFIKPDGMYGIIEDIDGNRGNLSMYCEVLIPLEN